MDHLLDLAEEADAQADGLVALEAPEALEAGLAGGLYAVAKYARSVRKKLPILTTRKLIKYDASYRNGRRSNLVVVLVFVPNISGPLEELSNALGK